MQKRSAKLDCEDKIDEAERCLQHRPASNQSDCSGVIMADADSRTCTVYALSSSEDGEVRYVGQTKETVRRRLLQHISKAKRSGGGTHREYWILSVLEKGFEIQCTVLQSNAIKNVDEMRWIAEMRSRGAKLVNATAGGEGLREPTADLRKRISGIVSALWENEEYRARMKAVHTGLPWSADRIAACQATAPEVLSERARKGRLAMPPELRSAISRKAAKHGWSLKRAMGTDRGEHCNTAKLTDDLVMEIRRRREQGISANILAKQYGLSSSAIGKVVNGETWSHLPVLGLPPIDLKGESSASATFTAAQIMDIRRRAASGETMKSIGDSYGKRRTTITNIVAGLTWKHLPLIARK